MNYSTVTANLPRAHAWIPHVGNRAVGLLLLAVIVTSYSAVACAEPAKSASAAREIITVKENLVETPKATTQAIPTVASDQKAPPPPIRSNYSMQHTVPAALPPIGSLLKLSFTLISTGPTKGAADVSRSTNQQIQASIVRDGELIVVPVSDVVLDERDRPRFEITVNAPIATLSYEVAVLDETGGVTMSRRYEMKRPCIPNAEISNATLDAQGPEHEKPQNGRAVLDELLIKTNALKSDIEHLDRAIKEIEELHGLLEKRQ